MRRSEMTNAVTGKHVREAKTQISDVDVKCDAVSLRCDGVSQQCGNIETRLNSLQDKLALLATTIDTLPVVKLDQSAKFPWQSKQSKFQHTSPDTQSVSSVHKSHSSRHTTSESQTFRSESKSQSFTSVNNLSRNSPTTRSLSNTSSESNLSSGYQSTSLSSSRYISSSQSGLNKEPPSITSAFAKSDSILPTYSKAEEALLKSSVDDTASESLTPSESLFLALPASNLPFDSIPSHFTELPDDLESSIPLKGMTKVDDPHIGRMIEYAISPAIQEFQMLPEDDSPTVSRAQAKNDSDTWCTVSRTSTVPSEGGEVIITKVVHTRHT